MKALTLLLALFATQVVVPPAQTARAAVTGRVRLADGSPVSGVRIAVVPVDASRTAILMNLGQTDASGAFRLEGVLPGRYYLMAGLIDSPTYFPSAKTQADAKVLEISAGATLEGMDFVLTRPPTVRVSGRLAGIPQGMLPGLLNMTLMSNDRSAGRGAPTPRLTTPVAGDGRFEFGSVTPGSYDLMIIVGNSAPFFDDRTPVKVDDRDVTNIAASAPPMLFGRVTLEGSGSLPVVPPNVSGLTGLAPSTLVGVGAKRRSDCCTTTFTVGSDGGFAGALRTDNLNGDYQVFVSQLPFGLYVRSVKSGSTDLLRTPLKVAKGTVLAPIEVTLTRERPSFSPTGVRIRGRVTGGAGPLSGSIVLRGRVPDIQSDLAVVDLQYTGQIALAADGSFSFDKVPPGHYDFRATFPPSGGIIRGITIPGRDVDGIEVQLSAPEVASIQGGRAVSVSMSSVPEIPLPAEPVNTGISPDRNLGTLTVSQSGRGPMYIEGAYSYFLVIASGSIVEEKRLAASSTSFSLPAGDYDLRAYARPCDGNCGNLDAPVDECRAPFTLKPGETVLVNKAVSEHNCTLKFSSSR